MLRTTGSFEGVVVVTGATGRLARRLLSRLEEDGYRTAGVGRAQMSRSDSASGRYEADLLDPAAVDACFSEIELDMGEIGALVHAAGAWAETPIETTPVTFWEDLIRANLVCTFVCFQAAAKRLRNGGRLIAFTAGQGADHSVANQSAYAAAKAGVIRLVESAALELGTRRIAAHAIAPSLILYDDEEADGVRADDLVELCLQLLTDTGEALNGSTLRAYGSR